MQQDKPLLTQYRKIKQENPDCVLMFRMGGFFVMYKEDAYVASKVLGLKSIRRNMGEGDIPSCGVPKAVVMKHAKNLAEKGYSVAICDQAEGESDIQGVMNRAVTEVVRPREGVAIADTISEDEYTDYIAKFKAKNTEQAQKKKHGEDSEIILELSQMNLENVTPTEAWAMLYHWKRTHCKTNDRL